MTTRTLLPTALALAIATTLLAACGGGGSTNVRSYRDPPPPPVPAAAPPEPCPAPVTADCTVNVAFPAYQEMTGGRQSDHALIKQGSGSLHLQYEHDSNGGPPKTEYSFGGNTNVQDGSFIVDSSASLRSSIVVAAPANLYIWGAVTGDVENHGNTTLTDKVAGNMVNDGVLTPEAYLSAGVIAARVEGNFTQSANGTLKATVPPDASAGTLVGGFLSVAGRADVDGTLQLLRYDDDWGPYALPTQSLSMQVLHADGGVFGQFAQWTSPSLFVTGALRYTTNDVYFDMTTVSASATMAAAGAGDAMTVRSAGHFDAAFGAVARSAANVGATFNPVQRQFLASVGTIQRLQDYSQAARVFDSLAGHGYADAANSLLRQAALPAPELMSRVGSLRAGSAAGAWASQSATLISGAGAFNAQQAGFDHWLGEHLLVGESFAWNTGNLRFDRSGGSAQDQSPQWDLYVRYNGNGNSYVFGDVGYGRHQLNLNRRIDLGTRTALAGAQRSLDVVRGYIELGRDYRTGGVQLTPFAATSYSELRGAPFVEQGATGFELIGQASTYRHLTAAAGLRLGADWGSADARWTRLDLSAGYRQLLSANDDAIAAFTGAPEATFALDGLTHRRGSAWLQGNLTTGTDTWNLRLSYDRQASDQALSLGAAWQF